MSSETAVIVGGGIIGTMHALEARHRGWEVVQLEADAVPRRASVRNFGLVWVGGRAPGPELQLALRSRELWEKIASYCPESGFRPAGSLTVAADMAELALMTEASSQPDARARGFELLDPTGIRSVNPAVRGEAVGGLWCRRDAVVEPGSVLPALRAALETGGGYRWLPDHRAVDVLPGSGPSGHGPVVVDHLGQRHESSLALLCIGDRLSGLGGRIGATLATAPLRHCRLQMMETAPASEHLATAVADGDSMRYYPSFDLPGRQGLPPARPETIEWGMQLLMVQRAHGGLTIGDTHVYEEPFDFAVDEAPYDRLRARAEHLLGWDLPSIVRRWAGVYTLTTDDRIYYRQRVDDALWVVTGPAGRGMTLSPAIAEETWEEVAA